MLPSYRGQGIFLGGLSLPPGTAVQQPAHVRVVCVGSYAVTVLSTCYTGGIRGSQTMHPDSACARRLHLTACCWCKVMYLQDKGHHHKGELKAIAKNGLPLYGHCSHAIAASFRCLRGSRSVSSANSMTNLQHGSPKRQPYRFLRAALVRAVTALTCVTARRS